MRILCGKRSYLLIKQYLYLFRMCCRMDAGEDNQAFSEHAILGRLKLFYFCHKFAGAVDLFCCIHESCSCCRVSLIFKTGSCTGSLLNFYHIAVSDQGCNLSRSSNHAVFTFFDIF